MKIIFTKEELEKACDVVSNISGQQSPLTIVQCVLIETIDGDRIRFMASDLESSVRYETSGTIEQEGRIAVSALKLSQLARTLVPGKEVTMETSDSNVKITSENVDGQPITYNLVGRDAIDFPDWPSITAVSTFEMKQQDLKEALEKVVIAIPPKDPRRFLLGANFDLKDNVLHCVATDGKLLSYVRAPVITTDETQNASILLPQKILDELGRNMGLEGNVKIIIAENQISFSIPNVIYVCNKINETFPNYENLIPKEFEISVEINKVRLGDAVKRAAVVSDEESHSVVFHFEKNLVSISAQQSNTGSEMEKVPVKFDGDDFEIMYNHRYLTEVLKCIDNKEIVLKFNGPVAPTLLQGVGDDYYLFIIMPIKIATEEVEEDEQEAQE